MGNKKNKHKEEQKMAQFTVDVAKLRTALSDLQKDHKDFNSEVDDLKKSEKTL